MPGWKHCEGEKKAILSGVLMVVIGTLVMSPCNGQALYRFQYPLSTSPMAGAELHLLLHNGLSTLENRYIPGAIFHENTPLSKTGNVLFRFMRMGTYQFYMAYVPVIHQHEYFGHLTRAKELLAGFTHCDIYFFPPTGGRAFYGGFQYHPLTGS
jgi:hypothetical protein